jgi:uncharacterized protein (DUF58 family)
MTDYFDPEVIGRTRNLEMRSLRLVESLFVGMHKSRLRGISTEFAQHRQYVIGDDTRHLDWKVFARTDRFYVRQYEAETNMPVYFLLDASPSMFFKSPQAAMSKFDYAATVVATLAYLLMEQKDLFGAAVFDEKIRTMVRARNSGSHFRLLLDALSKARPGGTTDIANAILNLGPMLKWSGMVFIVSDFVDDGGKLGTALGQLSYSGQDVVLLHVEDPVERDFHFRGQKVFLGMEGEGKLLCDPRDLRNAYLRKRRAHLEAIRQTAMRFRYSIQEMPTDSRLDTVLSGILSLRLAGRNAR